MSLNTLKKYIKFLKEKNILLSLGEHYQLITFYSACKILKINIDKRVLCFNHCNYKKITIKNIVKQYYQSSLLLNFNRQKYRIEQKKKEFDLVNKVENSKYTHKKTVKVLLKKYGSIKRAKQCVSKNYNNQIVTGKYHAAKLLNTSPSTANNILKGMVEDSLIKREIIVEKLNILVSHESFDALKSENKKQLYVPSSSGLFYYIPKGSKITLVSM